MAGNFAYNYNDLVQGGFFLGAYPVKDLSNLGLKVLLINGSLDSNINQERLGESKKLISKTSRNFTIKGGNHSQFGSYDIQKGD